MVLMMTVIVIRIRMVMLVNDHAAIRRVVMIRLVRFARAMGLRVIVAM